VRRDQIVDACLELSNFKKWYADRHLVLPIVGESRHPATLPITPSIRLYAPESEMARLASRRDLVCGGGH
jgi:hypothetical protein